MNTDTVIWEKQEALQLNIYNLAISYNKVFPFKGKSKLMTDKN